MRLILSKISCRTWWTPSNLKSRSGEWGSFSSIQSYRLGIRICQAFSVCSRILFPASNTGAQTAKTWFSCAHLMPARTFVSALTPCGIAGFFFFSPFKPAQTLELSATNARSCPCCGSMTQIHQVLNSSEFV